MKNVLIFVGGASASGKSTFVKELGKHIPNSIAYRRLDAFQDCAKKIDCPSDKIFEFVSPTDADNQIIDICYNNECVISDIHYALQMNKDFKSNVKERLYVSTISDYLMKNLINNDIIVIAVYINCDTIVLYNRAMNRFNKGIREMRSKNLSEVEEQKKYERLKWLELVKKYNISLVELDSQNNSPLEMVEEFINKTDEEYNVKKLINKNLN